MSDLATVKAAKIISIDESKPGFVHGLRYNDLVKSYNGQEILGAIQFDQQMSSTAGSTGIQIEIVRNSEVITLTCPGGDLGLSVSQPKEFSAKYLVPADRQDQIQAIELRATLKKMPLTTTHSIPGHEVQEIVGLVSAECVFGMNFIKDLFTQVRDIVGGRSGFIQKGLREGKQQVFEELKLQANEMGADGIVGVSLTYNEISGQANQMLMVYATGTAVKLSQFQS